MPNNFVFVATDEHGKAKKSDTLLIRSHCMQGKNKRANSRRSKREAKHAAEDISEDQARAMQLFAPHSEPSEFQLMRFAAKVDNRSRDILYKFFSYSASSSMLYPVEHCLDFNIPQNYLKWISEDPAFLHSCLLTASSVNDLILQRPATAKTSHHVRKTLYHLNSQLSEENGFALGSIIFIILTLGMTASMFNDYTALDAHVKGLWQIVNLRGGDDYLRQNPKEHFKIERLDLSRCLSTGEKPLPSLVPISWDPFFGGSLPMPQQIGGLPSVHGMTGPKLAVVYNDMRVLANVINDMDFNHTRMDGTLWQNAVSSIQQRLLALNGELENKISECLRLGMLAFLTTTFRPPGRKMPYPYLASQLRDTMHGIESAAEEFPHAVLWVIMISTVAVLDADEPWIQGLWNMIIPALHSTRTSTGLPTLESDSWLFHMWDANSVEISWGEMRQTLQGMIWLGCAHDELGRRAFLQLEESRRLSLRH